MRRRDPGICPQFRLLNSLILYIAFIVVLSAESHGRPIPQRLYGEEVIAIERWDGSRPSFLLSGDSSETYVLRSRRSVSCQYVYRQGHEGVSE